MSNIFINILIAVLIATLCVLIGSAYIYFNKSVKKEPTEKVEAEDNLSNILYLAYNNVPKVDRLLGEINVHNIRPYRFNNNPINIKRFAVNDWLGKVEANRGQFEKFIHPSFGIRASIKVILANIRATGSVKEFVYRIAVTDEDEIQQKHIRLYVRYLELKLGYIGKIREKDVIKVLKAMIFLEGGTGAVAYFGEYLECKHLENLIK